MSRTYAQKMARNARWQENSRRRAQLHQQKAGRSDHAQRNAIQTEIDQISSYKYAGKIVKGSK